MLDVGTGLGRDRARRSPTSVPGARVTGIDVVRGGAVPRSRQRRAHGPRRPRDPARARPHDRSPGGPYDLVVSNPPYVLPEEIDSLEAEVREWEPRQALVGRGATEAVARGAQAVLRPGGWLVLEVGDGQAAEVSSLLTSLGSRRSRRRPTSRDVSGWSRGHGSRRRGRRRAQGRTGRRPPDRHGLRPRRLAVPRGPRPGDLPPQAAPRDDADRPRRGERRLPARVRSRAARPRRDDRPCAAARPVHARAAQPGAELPLADGRPAGHDRRARAGTRRGRGRRARAGRRGGGDEREPARRPRPADARRRAGGDPRRGRRGRRRWRAARHGLDGDRLHRPGAAGDPRGRCAGRRGDRAALAALS